MFSPLFRMPFLLLSCWQSLLIFLRYNVSTVCFFFFLSLFLAFFFNYRFFFSFFTVCFLTLLVLPLPDPRCYILTVSCSFILLCLLMCSNYVSLSSWTQRQVYICLTTFWLPVAYLHIVGYHYVFYSQYQDWCVHDARNELNSNLSLVLFL